MQNGRLSGKVAIITGAARGMGETHARRFVAEGAKVLMTDVLDELGQKVANGLGPNALYMHQNVADADQWPRMVEKAEQTFGPVSILVNNAAISFEAPIEEYPLDQFQRTLDINQTAVFLGMKAVAASMRRAGGGSIINISSLAGLVGGPNCVSYAGAKFALRGMSKVAAIEFGRDKIRVNTVHPGAIKTPMLLDQPNFEHLHNLYANLSPLGRMGEPEEITNLVLFLASDEASFCTGAEFIADGGATAM